MLDQRYALTLRPVGATTLPDDLQWEFVALPRDTIRNDLPRSSKYAYGEFITNRLLTKDEMARFSIVAVE